MVEPEIAFCDLEGLMEVEEQFVSYIVQRCLTDCQPELKVLESDISHLEKVLPLPTHSLRSGAHDQQCRGTWRVGAGL